METPVTLHETGMYTATTDESAHYMVHHHPSHRASYHFASPAYVPRGALGYRGGQQLLVSVVEQRCIEVVVVDRVRIDR